MGLNCQCPAAEALPSVVLPKCKSGLGQIQRLIFQRVFNSDGTKNKIILETAKTKAGWTALFEAEDGTKAVLSPIVENPTMTPGAAKTYGGGNTTRSGAVKITGKDVTTFECALNEMPQIGTIDALEQLMCENIGVYFCDEYGNIEALADDKATEDTPPTDIFPIPIQQFFVGDLKHAGLEEPDANTMSFAMKAGWSKRTYIFRPTDFHPVEDFE